MQSGLEARYATLGSRGKTWGDLILAHVRSSRPTTRLWLDTLLPLAAGMVLIADRIRELGPLGLITGDPVLIKNAVLGILVINLVHLAGTLVNDVQDADSDRRSTEPLRRLRPIATGVIPKDLAMREAAGLVVIAVILSGFINWKVFAYCAVFTLLVAVHELPPTRTQSRPILSVVAGVVGMSGFVFPVLLVVGFEGFAGAAPYLMFIVIYMGFAEMIIKDVRDVDNDGAAGKKTFAVRYGAGFATRVAFGGYLLAAVTWFWFLAGSSPGERVWLGLGLAALLGWTVFVWFAGLRLDRGLSKSTCRALHRGSVTTFTALNVLVVLSLLL